MIRKIILITKYLRHKYDSHVIIMILMLLLSGIYFNFISAIYLDGFVSETEPFLVELGVLKSKSKY